MPPVVLAIVAGIVQGVVEWLPISSKTMITLIFAAAGYSFETAYILGLLANMGSFFAAFWYFRKDIAAALRGLRRPLAGTHEAKLLRYLVLAILATGVVGIPAYEFAKGTLSAATGTAAMLAIGGLLMVTSLINARRERLVRTAAREAAVDPPGPGASLIVGSCQGLAALPGVSRSAMTVTPLLLRGYGPEAALRFSFLLNVPALLGAGIVPLAGRSGVQAAQGVGLPIVIVLVVVSAIVSFFAIDTVLRVAGRLRSSLITLVIGLLTIGSALALGQRR